MQKEKNNWPLVFVFYLVFLYFTGCAAQRDYVYKREASPIIKDDSAKDLLCQSPEWIGGAALEKYSFSGECPVCRRRYQLYQRSCPYDGAELKSLD